MTTVARSAASRSRRSAFAVPDWALPWASVVAVLALFDVLPRVGLLPRNHFPPISETLRTLGEQLAETSFWEAVGNTLQGWALGLGIAAALAIPIRIVIGSSGLLYRAMRGLIEFLRPIPSVALIPLAILIYGTGLQSKVFGKTTLLKCMSGLLTPTRGEVRLHDERIDGPPERMALVFQEYGRSLYPWMSVRQNVAFPLRRKRIARNEASQLVERAVESVDLTGFLDRYPWELSGGMQQRVAIARALAYQPEILLMDEPFASVDAQTRADLEDLILEVRRQYGVTVVFVTHDIDESVYLGDRIVVLSPAPTRVQETLAVDLPDARDQLETKENPEFARLRAHVYRSIKRKQTDAEPRRAPDGQPAAARR